MESVDAHPPEGSNPYIFQQAKLPGASRRSGHTKKSVPFLFFPCLSVFPAFLHKKTPGLSFQM